MQSHRNRNKHTNKCSHRNGNKYTQSHRKAVDLQKSTPLCDGRSLDYGPSGKNSSNADIFRAVVLNLLHNTLFYVVSSHTTLTYKLATMWEPRSSTYTACLHQSVCRLAVVMPFWPYSDMCSDTLRLIFSLTCVIWIIVLFFIFFFKSNLSMGKKHWRRISDRII